MSEPEAKRARVGSQEAGEGGPPPGPPPAEEGKVGEAPPTAQPAADAPPILPPASPPPGQGTDWTEYWSDAHKRPFWYNTASGESVWTRPDSLPPAPTSAPASAPASYAASPFVAAGSAYGQLPAAGAAYGQLPGQAAAAYGQLPGQAAAAGYGWPAGQDPYAGYSAAAYGAAAAAAAGYGAAGYGAAYGAPGVQMPGALGMGVTQSMPSAADGQLLVGTVKAWMEHEGCGWVTPVHGGTDILVQRSIFTGATWEGRLIQNETVYFPQPEEHQGRLTVSKIYGPGVDAGPGPGQLEGVVKAWREDKGFGFITQSGGGEDLFVNRAVFAGANREGQLLPGRKIYYDAPSPDPRKPGRSTTAHVQGPGVLNFNPPAGGGVPPGDWTTM
eukprot:Hpha_TRINITY_DN26005_c0_g1::TRINITY_DN26005_c0_g1_i1::g.115120::m.115120